MMVICSLQFKGLILVSTTISIFISFEFCLRIKSFKFLQRSAIEICIHVRFSTQCVSYTSIYGKKLHFVIIDFSRLRDFKFPRLEHCFIIIIIIIAHIHRYFCYLCSTHTYARLALVSISVWLQEIFVLGAEIWQYIETKIWIKSNAVKSICKIEERNFMQSKSNKSNENE